MRTSGPIPDMTMPALPDNGEIPESGKKQENEFAAFGLDRRYPQVVQYLRDRQEWYQKYMPDGRSVTELSDAEAGAHWKMAVTIIGEIEAFINIVEISRDAVQQARRR